jgi:AcrR family transcriptional regulator
LAATPALVAKNRLGRPRKRPVGADVRPREDILDAAAKLFEAHGFGATTTRQIAAAAGLEQASMFHYFPRKDELLAELLDRTLEPALGYAGWLDRQSIPTDQKLYLLAYRDTLNICSGDHNLARLMHLPEARQPEFAAYWEKRLALKRTYGRYVASGLREGLFAAVEPALGTELVFAMVESTIEWFVRGRQKPLVAARDVAEAALRLLLASPRRLEAVIREASTRTEAGPAVKPMQPSTRNRT